MDSSGARKDAGEVPRELYLAMKQVAEAGRGPEQQFASMAYSIKWRTSGPWHRQQKKLLLRWDRFFTPWVLTRRARSMVVDRWRR